MALKRLRSRFNATLPRLRNLIGLEVIVIMSEKAFINSSQMILEEVDYMEKPA